MSKTAELPKVEPKVERWHTVEKVEEITSFKKSFLYQEMASGRLQSVKARGGRRIPESALAAWQASFDGSGEVDAQ